MNTHVNGPRFPDAQTNSAGSYMHNIKTNSGMQLHIQKRLCICKQIQLRCDACTQQLPALWYSNDNGH